MRAEEVAAATFSGLQEVASRSKRRAAKNDDIPTTTANRLTSTKFGVAAFPPSISVYMNHCKHFHFNMIIIWKLTNAIWLNQTIQACIPVPLMMLFRAQLAMASTKTCKTKLRSKRGAANDLSKNLRAIDHQTSSIQVFFASAYPIGSMPLFEGPKYLE